MNAAQAAKAFHISRSTLFHMRKIMRSGEEDLVQAVQNGQMTVHGALKELERRTNPISESERLWKKLLSDWARMIRTIDQMTAQDREQAIQSLKKSVDELVSEESKLVDSSSTDT
jgi:hypothetical protein